MPKPGRPDAESSHDSGLPVHVAIIMDGNGRWARSRGVDRDGGHEAGTENIRQIIESFADRGIRYLTLYAFSTENWGRPQDEVEGLMRILGDVIEREIPELHRNGIRLVHLGNLEALASDLQRKIRDAIELTRNNDRMTVCVAFNYGGRREIVEAVRELVREGLPADEIDEDAISARLYTSEIPDPDLVVRTAGEMRLSNFLLWQSAYAEYYSTPTLWPDFGPTDIDCALDAYRARMRRFGGRHPSELEEVDPAIGTRPD